MMSIESMARKEHREHPWTTMAQARRIARDHMRKNPGTKGPKKVRVRRSADYVEPSSAVECTACGGTAYYLGGLGKNAWYRCRNCGIESSVKTNPQYVDVKRMRMPRSGMERIYFSNGDMIYRTKSGVWGCALKGRASFSYCNAKSRLAAVESYEDLTGNAVVNK